MAYSARADIEARFGVANVSRWADLDSDGDTTKITNRITAAITYADATVNDETRSGVYTVPWSTVPEGIKNASVEIAGWWLYTARPRSGQEEDKGFDKMRDAVMKYLKRIRRGEVRFDLAYEEIAPYVVKVT